jgi:hypothetical protein
MAQIYPLKALDQLVRAQLAADPAGGTTKLAAEDRDEPQARNDASRKGLPVTATSDLGLDLDEGLEPFRPGAERPSLRPALVVLACAVVLSAGGFAVALIGSGQATPSVVAGLATPVPGVNLSAVGASQVLARISSGGTPPGDILDALVVPNGARIVSTTAQDAGVDQYDRSIYFEIGTNATELLEFYRTELRRARWSLLGTYGLPGGASELLAQRSGSDGYEWEVGVEVTTVNPSISPTLAGDGQTSAVMGLRLRLFEVPDGGS